MRKIFTAMCLSGSTSRMMDIEGYLDPYHSYHVTGFNAEKFKDDINELMTQANSCQWKAVWVTLNDQYLYLADMLTKQGFKMHSTQGGKLLLNKWLLNSESRLPHQSTHYVGVGGLIVHEDKVLLVQEKNGIRRKAWGVPGGLTDAQESVLDTAVREVKEETNLDTIAEDIVSIREMQQVRYGKAELYFLVKLKLNDPNQLVKICEKELMDYRWVPLNEMESFLTDQGQRQIVIEYYKYVQGRVHQDKYMDIERLNELYHGKMKAYNLFRPKF